MAFRDSSARDRSESLTLPGKVVKRYRIPLNCEPCRLRKLKCNRQRPCQNCVARAAAESCLYVAHATNGHTSTPVSSETEDVHARIKRLENLVLSLMPRATTSSGAVEAISRLGLRDLTSGPAREDGPGSDELAPSFMRHIVDGQQFIGESHWDIALCDIAAVKKYLDVELPTQHPLPQLVEHETPALLAGVPAAMNKAELLACLPTKVLSDQLVGRFFATYDPAIPSVHMLHQPTFLKQYEQHWGDISKAPLIWLGLLFSVFCLVMQSYAREGDEPAHFHGTSLGTANVFRTRAAQCILGSGISAPTPHAIETLMLYGFSEYSRLSNGNVALWMLWGIVVRKAMQMGYHRDPRSFTTITLFKGELRRRLWMAVSQMDLLLSFQLGLPTMIHAKESDIESPRYVYEEELYEEMQELPPSRSPSEPTPICYLITKNHIFRIFGKVVEYLNSCSHHSYDRICELNEELCNARASIPDHLKLEEPQLTTTPQPLTLQRMHLQMFYHKAICVLNRRFILGAGNRARFARSRWLCLDSAMSLLSIQATMHRSGMKWYLFSLTNHDFLLAAVIVCLVLHSLKESEGFLDDAMAVRDGFQTPELFAALETTNRIWHDIIESSSDALRATRVLGFVLEKLQTPGPDLAVELAGPSAEDETGNRVSSLLDDPAVQHTAAEMPSLDRQASTLDWETWDSIIHGADFENLDSLWSL